MSPPVGVRTRSQKIATLRSEEMSVRFSAHSIVHNKINCVQFVNSN